MFLKDPEHYGTKSQVVDPKKTSLAEKQMIQLEICILDAAAVWFCHVNMDQNLCTIPQRMKAALEAKWVQLGVTKVYQIKWQVSAFFNRRFFSCRHDGGIHDWLYGFMLGVGCIYLYIYVHV